jgi:hypothetical protein
MSWNAFRSTVKTSRWIGRTLASWSLAINKLLDEDWLMPDEPKGKPSLDDIVRDFGYDKMAFFCDMVRPDQHEEREEDADLPTEIQLTPEHERAVIEHIESELGRKLTQQEINLALDQARSI